MNSSGESTLARAFCTVSGAQATRSWMLTVVAGARRTLLAKPRAASSSRPWRSREREGLRSAGGAPRSGGGVGGGGATLATAVGATEGAADGATADGMAAGVVVGTTGAGVARASVTGGRVGTGAGRLRYQYAPPATAATSS